MSFQGKLVGRVIRRERTRTPIDGSYYDEIVLAIQVISGEGLEKGHVYVRAFNRKDTGNVFYNVMLLKEGHTLSVPFEKEEGKLLKIHRDKLVVGTGQFGRDWAKKHPEPEPSDDLPALAVVSEVPSEKPPLMPDRQ